jgi:hypothetical protein
MIATPSTGYAFHAAHALKMRGRDGVDEADIGPCDGGEIGDVARLACAHFQHGELRVLRHSQQGQRQAQLVVVVACVDVGTPVARQDRCRQRLHRGLAVGTGDADHPHVALRTHGAGQVAQREHGVVHQHLRQRRLHLARHQCSHGAARHGLAKKIVAIDALALHRDEQVAGLQFARINGHAGDIHVGAQQTAPGPQGNGAQTHHACASNASRATARSSNGRFPVAPS